MCAGIFFSRRLRPAGRRPCPRAELLLRGAKWAPAHNQYRHQTDTMTWHVESARTICLKGVPAAHAKRVCEAVVQAAPPTHGMTHSPEREQGRGDECLVYANYASAVQAQRARDRVQTWVQDKWPPQWGLRPQVMMKSDLEQPFFAVYVDGAAPGTPPGELYDVFAQFGRLHPTRQISAVNGKDNAYFVNFADYEGAMAAWDAARSRAVRFQGSILNVNGARNTTFVNALLADMRKSGRSSFSLDDAKSVAEQMKPADKPPQESNIVKLLHGAPQHFVLDRATKQFHLIGRNAFATMAHTARASPSRSPSPTSPLSSEEERAFAQRTDTMNHFVHGSFDLLKALFLTTWFQAKGKQWVDSEGWASSSAEELKDELCRTELPPTMLKPVADWDLTSLASALAAPSLKAKLQSTSTGARAAEHDPTCARWIVLVDAKIMSEKDLVSKYGPTFTESRDNAFQAVKTIRIVRNLLCHLQGSVKGLSQASFDCLWCLTSEALSVVANVLGGEHPARLADRRASLLSSLGERTSTASLPASIGDDQARYLDDSLSVCSCAPTEVAEHEHVKSWDVEQVIAFFERCKFPTQGIQDGQVDGETLVNLYEDAEAETIFTAKSPEGLGLNRLMFKGRFKKEMDRLL